MKNLSSVVHPFISSFSTYACQLWQDTGGPGDEVVNVTSEVLEAGDLSEEDSSCKETGNPIIKSGSFKATEQT